MSSVAKSKPVTKDTPAHDAVERLLEQYGARIHGLALKMCGNVADAEDMVQTVFMTALRKWSTFRGDAQAGTWLYAIAIRSCKNRMREKGGARRHMPALSQVLPFGETRITEMAAGPGAGIDASEESAKREAIAAVQAAIAKLPEHFRLPLILKDVLEMPVEDVASTLAINENTVKTRLHRARLLLRQVMTKKAIKVDAPAPIYEKQVCMDLLKSKLSAMDEGREQGFKVTQSEICDRCRAVFKELDLVQTACSEMGRGKMPPQVRAAVLKAVRAEA